MTDTSTKNVERYRTKSKGAREVAIDRVTLADGSTSYVVLQDGVAEDAFDSHTEAVSLMEDLYDALPMPPKGWYRGNFTWGSVVQVHEAGEYQVVEYVPNQAHGVSDEDYAIEKANHGFHPFINGDDTGCGFSSLEEALLGCFVKKFTGTTQPHVAVGYITKMLEMP